MCVVGMAIRQTLLPGLTLVIRARLKSAPLSISSSDVHLQRVCVCVCVSVCVRACVVGGVFTPGSASNGNGFRRLPPLSCSSPRTFSHH